MPFRIACLLLCLLSGLLFGAAARADEEDAAKPLWEIGVGGGAAYVPDYPASRHSQFTGIALPYAIYRGRIFRADEDGIRGRLSRNGRVELSLGVDAAFSADSDDNRERRGMPDLDYLLEIGPSLEYRLARRGPRRLSLVGQARAAFAVNTDRFDYTGIAVEPQLVYEDKAFVRPRLELTVGLGSKFAYDGLNQYFYSVDPRFATARRPAYEGHDGYQQSALSTRLFYPFTRRLSGFAAGQLLFNHGSANRDSPLFGERLNVAFGAGLAWSLWVSQQPAGE